MLAAAPAVAPAASPVTSFDWHHQGSPDLTDPAVLAVLPVDLYVILSDLQHRFIKATPCLDWTDQTATVPTDPPVGKRIPQWQFDRLCAEGGVASPWLRGQDHLLTLSNVPEHGRDLCQALTAVGGLDLDRVYQKVEELWVAVRAAKWAARGDNRLVLVDQAFFADEARPYGGRSAAAAVARNWMHLLSGQALLGEDDCETEAFAMLRTGVEPKRMSIGRDLAKDKYCRILGALKEMTSNRSDFLQTQIANAETTDEEIAEYVAETWMQLVRSGFPFALTGRLSQCMMELDLARSLAGGTEAQKEMAFRQLFPKLVQEHVLVTSCVKSKDGAVVQHDGEMLGHFEQLAGEVLPGVKWCSASCLKSVEHELNALNLSSLISTWGESPLEIISNVRSHFRQVRALAPGQKFMAAAGANGEDDSVESAVSLMGAMREKAFLDTVEELKSADKNNFLEHLDILLASHSKLCYMKGIRQFNKATSVEEIERCSKHLRQWSKYWPMAASRGTDGQVHKEVQGRCFPEKDVVHLLNGEWHLIDWIKLIQLMDLWINNSQMDSSVSYGQYGTLHSVKKLVFKTMKLMKLARSSDDEDDCTTCAGFIEKIISLERRSKSMPKGSQARKQALQNVVDVMMRGLKEFGENWASQWIKPVSYNENLSTKFASQSCFVWKDIDKIVKVADQMYDYKEVLPVLFKGSAWNGSGRSGRDSGDDVAEEHGDQPTSLPLW